MGEHRSDVIPVSNCVGITKLAVANVILNKNSETLIIQIGACDGKEDDPLYQFLKQGETNAILFEPLPNSFSKLRKAYEGLSKIKLVNAAISRKDDEEKIYSVKNKGRWEGSSYAPMLTSFSKKHLLNHGVIESEIETIKVKTVRLSTFVKNNSIHKINLMIIDTEGFDAKIVEMMMEDSLFPDSICFEHVHIKSVDIKSLFKKLYDNGYRWISDVQNTLAVKNDKLR